MSHIWQATARGGKPLEGLLVADGVEILSPGRQCTHRHCVALAHRLMERHAAHRNFFLSFRGIFLLWGVAAIKDRRKLFRTPLYRQRVRCYQQHAVLRLRVHPGVHQNHSTAAQGIHLLLNLFFLLFQLLHGNRAAQLDRQGPLIAFLLHLTFDTLQILQRIVEGFRNDMQPRISFPVGLT